MENSRNYNLIAQKFTTGYNDIPFIKTNHKSDYQYNVSVEIFNTDYIKSFFETFDLHHLYAIYILNNNNLSFHSDLDIISEYIFLGKTVIIAKVDFSLFINLDYTTRDEVSSPYFFKSDHLESLKMEEILKNSLYEKEIITKTIVTLDALKLLENKEINTVIKFYTNLVEAFLEDILNLNRNTLDVKEEFISKLEISLSN